MVSFFLPFLSFFSYLFFSYLLLLPCLQITACQGRLKHLLSLGHELGGVLLDGLLGDRVDDLLEDVCLALLSVVCLSVLALDGLDHLALDVEDLELERHLLLLLLPGARLHEV